jgi:hypothetical protein
VTGQGESEGHRTTVSELTTAPWDTRKASFWYGLPVGYVSPDLQPPAERLMEIVHQLRGLPAQERDEAARALRLYAGIIGLLNTHRVQECALGMHPDDAGGFTTSVFTVSTLPTSGSAKFVVAGLAGSAADSRDEDTRPLQLPCGLGFLSEKRPPAPRSSRLPEASDAAPSHLWQGTVAVAAPSAPELIVLQMMAPDLDADDYRNILLGIARTLTFTDPARAAADDQDREPEAPTGAAVGLGRDRARPQAGGPGPRQPSPGRRPHAEDHLRAHPRPAERLLRARPLYERRATVNRPARVFWAQET